MPWYFPWSDALNKRACRYLLQRYLGDFLQEKLSLDQLSVNLYSGTGKINDVFLDVQALNSSGEKFQLPFEFVDGFIASISVSIPWSCLLSESSVVEVNGLMLTLQPKPRLQNVSSTGSLFGSMVSSLQLAEDFMKERPLEDEKEVDAGQPFEALELFAQTIDTVFRRIKVTFTDTVIRLDHVTRPGNTGTAIEFRIKRLEYFDEAGIEETTVPEAISSQDHVYHPVAFATKKFRLEGVSLYTDEFSSKNHLWRSQSSSDPKTPDKSGDISPGVLENESFNTSAKEDSKPPSDEESEELGDLVLMTRLVDHQEIRLKLKQDDNIPGPQAEVEINFGPIPLFLCPRQIHLILEIVNSLHSPSQGQKYQNPSVNKPMGLADFTLVEKELQKHLTQPTVFSRRSLQQPQGWSSHSLDDSEEDFQPARGTASTMSASKTSVSCDLESSFESKDLTESASTSGKPPSSLYSRPARTKVQELLNDSSTSEVRFHVTCSSLCLVILHEDLVVASQGSLKTSQENTGSNVGSLFKKYFDELTLLLETGDSLKDFVDIKEKITKICGTNHIRLMAAPIVLEGNRKSSNSGNILTTSLTIANLELFECLMDKLNSSVNDDMIVPTYTELLKFSGALPYSKDSSLPFWNEPSLRLKYIQRTNTAQTFREPLSTLVLQMGPFQSELDVTIIDRLHYLIKQNPTNSKWDSSRSFLHSKLLDEDRSISINRMDINISSPFVELNVRFPIPDLRPLHSLERIPWWKKNLRDETLILEMTEVTLSNIWNNEAKESKYEIQCKDAHALLQMNASETPISFARISVDPRADKNSTEHGFDWPRLVLKITQAKTASVLETNIIEDELDDFQMATSMHSMFLHKMHTNPLSPFTSRKIVYDRSSPEGSKFSTVGDTDQVVMPADKERMTEFVEKTMTNCKITFDISLPTLNLILPSKEFYEILYNRISNDLALWEPAAPKPVMTSESIYFDGHNLKNNLLKESTFFEAFSFCKSGAQYDSSSDSEDGGSNFYSVMGPTTRNAFKSNKKVFPPNVQAQSELAINVNIEQGIFNFCTEVEESDSDEYQGEFQINVENGSFFFVSSHNGDPNLNYSCLNLNQGVLFHNGFVLKTSLKKLKPAVLYSPAHLKKTLYRSDPNVLPANNVQTPGERVDLLSLVIRTGLDPNQGLKTFKVAVGLQEATLQHRMTPMSQSWLSQFINFFDVSNHPVVGYTPPPIITELHLHLNTCAVDYRPLYLPLRAFASVDNFSISSNLAAQASASLLRIISEELLLYISNKTDSEMVDLKNYVCVLDTGLFDISLRMSDGKDSSQPVTDLRATNNTVHIHTCSDSCRALQEMITYFASDGDLLNTNDTFFDASDEPYSLIYNSGNEAEPDTLVNRLMEEAMQESLDNISESSIEVEESEECKEQETVIKQSNPPYLAADSDSPQNISNDSDEFCILEEDLGTGIIPPSGEPQVRLLSHEPFNVIENHFAKPIGRSDQLKAPSHYPKPIKKYTLREMSLVWHLYGGCDFQTLENKPEKEKVQKKTRIVTGEGDDLSLNSLSSSPKYGVSLNLKNQGTSYKKLLPHESIWTNINSIQNGASSPESRCRSPQPGMGGVGRLNDVVVELQMNKMRFQYEVYPEKGDYDSRQVLLIQDVEIRDRLATSEINKFLYQFSSEALPRQTHANMLLIKAVHERPDPNVPKSECSLKISLKPLRLNIDQDTLLFLCGFFGKLYGSENPPEPSEENVPVQTNIITDCDPIIQSCHNRNDPLLNSVQTDLSDASVSGRTAPPIYFKSFVFSPDVPIQLDYHGKRFDMDQGALAGLLMGLGQLNKSKIILKRVSFRHGLLGFDRLVAYVINEWLQDIKKNQLPSLLGGLGPMYSFVQLFQGVRDLIWLPIEQYRKDGRIMRGIQRGANSFTTSTAMAFLELTNRMVLIIQGAAEFAYDMVSPGPSVKSRSQTVQKKWHLSSEPLDIREGVAYAYHVVREGIGDTARTIVRVASEEHEHKGMPGAVGGVLRQIPPIVVKPIILATEATANVLGGVRNQLVPDARRDAVEKWRGRTAH